MSRKHKSLQEYNAEYRTKKVGRLTILDIFKNAKNRLICECLCDCGTKSEHHLHSLLIGDTKSCGCLQKEQVAERLRKESGKSTYTSLYLEYKSNAMKRNLQFSITLEEFIQIVKQNCHYCNSEPKNVNRYFDKNGQVYLSRKLAAKTLDNAWAKANGIDRKNNDLGYILSNCLPCCVHCNKAKDVLDYEDFINYLNKLTTYRNSLINY